MAVVPLAPEAGATIGAATYALCGLVALLGYIVVRGLIASWTHSLGFLLNWLAGELSFSVNLGFTHAHLDIGGPFKAADNIVLSALQSWAAGLEYEVGYFFHGSERMIEWMAGQIQGLAGDTADTFEWLVHSYIPKLGHAAVADVMPAVRLVRLIDSEIERLVPKVGKLTHVIEHDVTHTITHVIRYAGSIAVPNPWAFPAFHRWWHDLTKWREVTLKRLARLEKLLGVAGMAAAMAGVLGLKDWRCLTKGNIGKVSRALCGLSSAALQDLLGLVVDALVLTNICTIIGLLESGLTLIEPELLEFVTGLEAFACYGSAGTVPALGGPAPFLPATAGVTLYLA